MILITVEYMLFIAIYYLEPSEVDTYVKKKRENNIFYSHNSRSRVISASQHDKIYDVINHRNPQIEHTKLAYNIFGDASKTCAMEAEG